MDKRGIKIVLPSAATDVNLRKLEHYYGIEFTRGVSGEPNGKDYHRMLGDESLLSTLHFHNQMKIASVAEGRIQKVLNQTNWNLNEDGTLADVAGLDGSDIMQVHTSQVYAIIGGTDPTYERFIVSDRPFSYGGDTAKAYGMPGETPDYVTEIAGVLRSVANDSVSGTQYKSVGNSAGLNAHVSGLSALGNTSNTGGFPKSLKRLQYETKARAKNAGGIGNLPYSPLNNVDLELTVALMFIEFRTKNLGKCLGYGISCSQMPSSANWGNVSGFKLTSGGETIYKSFGAQMYPGGGTTAMNMWKIVNQQSPLLKIFQAQLGVSSDASTLSGVSDSDGNAVQGISEGVMTGIWTKRYNFRLNASTTSGGESKMWDVEMVLRVPVWRGKTRLWGHLGQLYSGYEILKSESAGNSANAQYDLYRAPKVESLVYAATEGSLDPGEPFGFESAYEHLGVAPYSGLSTQATLVYGLSMFASGDGVTTAFVKTPGGAASTGESAGFMTDSAAPNGKVLRRTASAGGAATNDGLLRKVSAAHMTEDSGASGSGFHVQLTQV